MADVPNELKEQAKALAPEERARLVEVEAAWDSEIERRVAAHDRGEVQTISAEDVFAEAKRLARRLA